MATLRMLVLLLLIAAASQAAVRKSIPLGLDLYMPVPDENPLTAEKIDLGRRLFNDRRLSRDGSIACASCHNPDRAFSDGRAVPVGVFGREGRRNAPALINRGYGARVLLGRSRAHARRAGTQADRRPERNGSAR